MNRERNFKELSRLVLACEKDLIKEYVDHCKETCQLNFYERWVDRLLVCPLMIIFFIFALICCPIFYPIFYLFF